MHGAIRLAPIARVAVFSAVAAIAFSGVGLAADALYYKQEDGAIVFTNIRGAGLRPVPGFSGRHRVAAANPLPSTVHDGFIEYLASETGVSADLIKAVAIVESGFDANARSPKGALGLMQLMPEVARRYGVDNPYDPRQNLRGGATHLSLLLDRYDGDLTLTLAAYNAGSGAVKRYGGVPPYRETRDYIRKVHNLLGGNGAPRLSPRRERAGASTSPVRVVYAADGTISLVN